MIIVSVSQGSYATVSMHTKDSEGSWKENYSVSARIGKNGIGKTREGDGKTPVGVYTFGQAFGIAVNPGSTRDWLTLNSDHYWVDDSNSPYYNRLVDASVTGYHWSSAQHLVDYKTAYKYAIAVNYNIDCIPGKGSAIFLHCSTGNARAGCISIPEEEMISTLRLLREDCKIIIDYNNNIFKY